MKNILINLTRGGALLALATTLAGCLELSMIKPWAFSGAPAARTTRQVVPPVRPTPAAWNGDATTPQERLAWRLLDERCYREASSAFARGIRDAPGAARPYVGLALSTAMDGDLCGGSKAMRAALRVDPCVLDSVEVSPWMGRVLDTLIDEYHYDLRAGAPVAETALTLSALHYLRGDLDRADSALALCRRSGGRTTLTDRYAMALDDRLAPAPVVPTEPLTRLARTPVYPPIVSPAPPRTPTPSPTSVPVPTPVPTPAPETNPPTAPRPAPGPVLPPDTVRPPVTTPVLPTEPVDYDELRTGILDASDALDRFTDKLLGRIADAETR